MIVSAGGRQSGKTMARLMTAPRGSTFVCPKANVGYVQRLANSIGRDDLHIVDASGGDKSDT